MTEPGLGAIALTIEVPFVFDRLDSDRFCVRKVFSTRKPSPANMVALDFDVRFTPNSGHSTMYFAVDARRAEVIPGPARFSDFFEIGGGRTFWNF